MERAIDHWDAGTDFALLHSSLEISHRALTLSLSRFNQIAGLNLIGPTFQGLVEAQTCTGEACFTLAITDTKGKMPAKFEYEHLLHPSTLDCALQTATLATERKAGITGVTMVVRDPLVELSVASLTKHQESLLVSNIFGFPPQCQ